jgi:hypothetical protein
LTPASAVTSANFIPPWFSSNFTPFTCVMSTSGLPSLFTSPMARPMFRPGKSSPDPADTSSNAPSGFWR